MSARCRSCGARILWARTEKGKFIPLNEDPSDAGTLVLVFEGDQTPTAMHHGSLGRAADDVRWERFVPHWSTCPNAAEHRAQKAKAAQ